MSKIRLIAYSAGLILVLALQVLVFQNCSGTMRADSGGEAGEFGSSSGDVSGSDASIAATPEQITGTSLSTNDINDFLAVAAADPGAPNNTVVSSAYLANFNPNDFLYAGYQRYFSGPLVRPSDASEAIRNKFYAQYPKGSIICINMLVNLTVKGSANPITADCGVNILRSPLQPLRINYNLLPNADQYFEYTGLSAVVLPSGAHCQIYLNKNGAYVYNDGPMISGTVHTICEVPDTSAVHLNEVSQKYGNFSGGSAATETGVRPVAPKRARFSDINMQCGRGFLTANPNIYGGQKDVHYISCVGQFSATY